MKYITIDVGGAAPVAILFSPNLRHADIGKFFSGRILTAGFVHWKNGRAHCTGFSTSLGACANPMVDDALIEFSFQLTADGIDPRAAKISALRPHERDAVEARNPLNPAAP